MPPEALLLAGVLIGVGVAFAARRWAAGRDVPLPDDAEATSTAARSAELPDAALDPPTELVFGPPHGPLVTVVRARHPAGAREQVPLNPQVRARLQPLLVHVPRVLAVGAETTSGGVRVVMTFSPEVTRGLADGGLELVRSANMPGAVRALARGPDGRIVEHANLVAGVNPAAMAVAFWQVAALVTAQKFLADIDLKLRKLSEGVEWLKTFVKDEKRARLVADAERLMQCAQVVARGQVEPAELRTLGHEVEAIDRDAHACAEHMLQSLERAADQLATQPWDGSWWNADDVHNAAVGVATDADDCARLLLLALRVRAASWVDP